VASRQTEQQEAAGQAWSQQSCGHFCGSARVVPAGVSGDGGTSRTTQEGTYDGWDPELESLPDTHGRWPGIEGERPG
jgi:hypothetical protein